MYLIHNKLYVHFLTRYICRRFLRDLMFYFHNVPIFLSNFPSKPSSAACTTTLCLCKKNLSFLYTFFFRKKIATQIILQLFFFSLCFLLFPVVFSVLSLFFNINFVLNWLLAAATRLEYPFQARPS